MHRYPPTLRFGIGSVDALYLDRHLVPVLPCVQPHVKGFDFVGAIVIENLKPTLASHKAVPLFLVGDAWVLIKLDPLGDNVVILF